MLRVAVACVLAFVWRLCLSSVARLLSRRCCCWVCCFAWLRAAVLVLRCLLPLRAAGLLSFLRAPPRSVCSSPLCLARARVGSVVCVAAAVASACRLRARCVRLFVCSFVFGLAVAALFLLLCRRPVCVAVRGADWMTSSLNKPSRMAVHFVWIVVCTGGLPV